MKIESKRNRKGVRERAIQREIERLRAKGIEIEREKREWEG